MFSGFKKKLSKAGSNITKAFGGKAHQTTASAGEGASAKVDETGKAISTKFSAAEPYVQKGVDAADSGIKQGVTAADSAINQGVATAEDKLQSVLGSFEDTAQSAIGGAEASAKSAEDKQGLSMYDGRNIKLRNVNSGRVITLEGSTIKADGAEGAPNAPWRVKFVDKDMAFSFEQNGQFIAVTNGAITATGPGPDTLFKVGSADGNITFESMGSPGTYLAFDSSGNPQPSSSPGKEAQFSALPL